MEEPSQLPQRLQIRLQRRGDSQEEPHSYLKVTLPDFEENLEVDQ